MIRIIGLIFAFVFFCSPSIEAKKEWDEEKGLNFIIYYRDVPLDFVETVMKSAEEEFKNITENLGIIRYQNWSWKKRAAIYIYRDREDYIQNGGQGWSHGSAMVGAKIIKTYPLDNGFFDSILPHELGHIIFREFVGEFVDVPLWFDEGVAMNQEKARRLGADKIVREAMKKGQFIPLTQLTDVRLYNDTPKETIELFYAESASIVYFMMTEWGQQHFFQFCRHLKDSSFNQALAKTYARVKNIEDLNKMWVMHLEEQ